MVDQIFGIFTPLQMEFYYSAKALNFSKFLKLHDLYENLFQIIEKSRSKEHRNSAQDLEKIRIYKYVLRKM